MEEEDVELDRVGVATRDSTGAEGKGEAEVKGVTRCHRGVETEEDYPHQGEEATEASRTVRCVD